MELQLKENPVAYLRTVIRETQTQEQTQELRIGDGMPDIGSIVGTWGQVIVRSKEWEPDMIRISGGTMVWVQYRSEDGEEICCVDSWLPFQMQWKLPPDQRDGTILCQCFLKSADARITSARKMMVRTNVTILAEGTEPAAQPIFAPADVPENLQLQRMRYPACIPVEAGEKAFTLDEMLSMPANQPQAEKILSYRLQPTVTENKLMGNKLVFRGKASLHLHYADPEGRQHSWDTEVPFSQYCDLEGDYDTDGQVRIWPCVTALETELQQNQLRLKVGMVCQYRICRKTVLEVVKDAYATDRTVSCEFRELEIPMILEHKEQTVKATAAWNTESVNLADVQFLPQPAAVYPQQSARRLELSGQFQPLSYDPSGSLRWETLRWSDSITLQADENVTMEVTMLPKGMPTGSVMNGNGQLECELELQIDTLCDRGISAVTSLSLGEVRESDPNRPSLILKRAADQSLWEIAKESGSTVSLIRTANGLQDEPEEGQMLLIPVV